MNKTIFLAVLLLCTVLACTKSTKSTTGDPTEDSAWLKAKKTEMAKNCTCEPAIWKATYEGRTVYETGCKGPACNCAHSFYNEDGSLVKGSEEANRVVFLEKLKERTLLWTCR